MKATLTGTSVECGKQFWHFCVAYDDGTSEPLHLKDGENAGWDEAEATALAESMAAELAADRELLALLGQEV